MRNFGEKKPNRDAKIYFLSIMVIIVALSSTFIVFSATSVKNPYIISPKFHLFANPKSSDPDPPIYLSGNGALASFCTIGNGTSLNPYIIENYTINASLANGITLKNSNAHTLIRNCSITDADSAILLENCENIEILNVNLSNSYDGVRLLECNSTTINSSYLADHRFGATIKRSHNTTLVNNTFYDCVSGVFLLWDSRQTNITQNIFPETSEGVNIYDATHTTISHNNMSGNTEGMRIQGGDYNTILFNDVTHTSMSGIWIIGSSGNTIVGNNCSYSGWNGIFLQGGDNYLIQDNNCSFNFQSDIYIPGLRDSIVTGNIMEEHGITAYGLVNVTIDSTNIVNGKPIYYYRDQRDVTLSEMIGVGQLILQNCTNFVVENVEIANCGAAITLDDSHQNIIRNTNLVNTSFGIVLFSSNYNQVYGNSITSQIIKYGDMGFFVNFGIGLQYSSHNSLYENYCRKNGAGFVLYDSPENLLQNNTCVENRGHGMYLHGSEQCDISENQFLMNGGSGLILGYTSDSHITKNVMQGNRYGISLHGVSNCNFLMNVLKDNEKQQVYVEDYSSCSACSQNYVGRNKWKGNFYSDYQQKYPNAKIEANGVIWTLSYTIDDSNTDHYPLVDPSLIPQLEKIFKTEIIINIILIFLGSSGLVVLLSVVVRDKLKSRKRPDRRERIGFDDKFGEK